MESLNQREKLAGSHTAKLECPKAYANFCKAFGRKVKGSEFWLAF